MPNRQRNSFSVALILLTTFGLGAGAEAQAFRLRCPTGAFQIETSTLAITWYEGGEKVSVSGPLRTRAVSTPVANDRKAAWEWKGDGSSTRVAVAVEEAARDGGCVLRVRLTSSQPGTLDWFALPSDRAEVLLLPFGEGMRVPTEDSRWIQFLTERKKGADTTFDLKLPLWSFQSTPINGESSPRWVHVVVDEPFSNTLRFDEEEGRLSLQAQHRFTKLNLGTPMEVSYSIGGHALSGAQRYRDERAMRGNSDALTSKARRNPDVRKLIGAPHVYLHGAGLLDIDDVQDWSGLRDWFFDSTLAELTRDPSPAEIAEIRDTRRLHGYQKWLLLRALEDGLQSLIPPAYPLEDPRFIEGEVQALQRRREWLALRAGRFLDNPDRWGQGLSRQHLVTLGEAGLEKLWLGLVDRRAAFAQPELVTRARARGWLVSTYDSYNTGIDPVHNESWITAHMPTSLREGCAFIDADGRPRPGFARQGVYLNPECVRGFARHRIAEILRWGRLDGLFLDADATGMVREDHPSRHRSPPTGNSLYTSRDDRTELEITEAFDERMTWTAERTVVASEDGSAVTTRGLSLAHGMETVPFGWGDPEVRGDPQSPYFVGAWYPAHRPRRHFDPVPVKEPYRTLLFSPEFRVPLYQAVFHDEIVVSHHWELDNLKLEDVREKRDLLGMLYATPPLVHLSRRDVRSTTTERVAALQHYQRGFRPLHEELWDESLERFDWLDDAGLVQRCTFGDGSTVVANFGHEPVEAAGLEVPPLSIVARLATGPRRLVTWSTKP